MNSWGEEKVNSEAISIRQWNGSQRSSEDGDRSGGNSPEEERPPHPAEDEGPPRRNGRAYACAASEAANGSAAAAGGADSEQENTYADLDSRLYDGPALMALNIPEPEWLVPGLVSRGNLTLLAGMGKLGKSVLAHQLCIAGATGGVWLDQHLPVMNTLYVNWEDPLNLTRARAVQQFTSRDLPVRYHVLDVPLETPLNRFLAWLRRTITERKIELVVIDPLATAAHWEDEDDNDLTRDTMRHIQEVAARTGAAIFPVHHIRKSGGEYGMELRGAGAIFNGLQGYLSFKRQGEGKYRLDVLNKMPGEHGGDRSLILERDPHTLTWHLSGTVSQQEVDKEETEARILGFVDADPGITVPELSKTSEIAESTVRRYVKALIGKGILHEVVRPKRPADATSGRAPKGLFFNPGFRHE